VKRANKDKEDLKEIARPMIQEQPIREVERPDRTNNIWKG